MRFAFPILIFCLLGTACGPDYVYRSEYSLTQAQWRWDDTLRFCFTMTDTIGLYDIYLDAAYLDTFAYQNFYCQLHTRFPDGHTVSTLKTFDLFDNLGQPNGRFGGQIGRMRILLQNDTWFNQQGDYCIVAEQYTRDEALGGLSAMGLSIVKNGKQRTRAR